MKLTILALLSSLLLLNLSACSRIKSYFPDKERDYQLTTEIPPLAVPEDLSDTAIADSPVAELAVIPKLEPIKTTPVSSEKKSEKKQVIYVDLVEYSGGATRIRIEETLERTWRTVGKALSRQSIEITSRNELENVYYVQYDPDFKEVEDGSLWDEALFIFGSDPANEKEFRIRLSENGSLTEIIVLNSKDVPLSKGPGLKLLNLLYETIKADLTSTD